MPLVAHGGTSFPPDAVRCGAGGVAKFNVGTVLKRTFLAGLTEAVAALPVPASAASVHDAIGSHLPQDVLAQTRARMVPVVRELIQLYGGAGRALEPVVLLDLYRTMCLIRRFEDRVYHLFLDGEIPGTLHQYQGQEAVAAGVCSVLRPTTGSPRRTGRMGTRWPRA